jgi:hypothetical protein
MAAFGLVHLRRRQHLQRKARIYQGFPGRTQDIVVNFVALTFGVSGRF